MARGSREAAYWHIFCVLFATTVLRATQLRYRQTCATRASSCTGCPVGTKMVKNPWLISTRIHPAGRSGSRTDNQCHWWCRRRWDKSYSSRTSVWQMQNIMFLFYVFGATCIVMLLRHIYVTQLVKSNSILGLLHDKCKTYFFLFTCFDDTCIALLLKYIYVTHLIKSYSIQELLHDKFKT